MDKFLPLHFANLFRKYAVSVLACSWIAGLFLGIFISGKVSLDLDILAVAFQNRSSIILMTVMLLPVVASVFVQYAQQLWMLPLVAFLKSFSFAYVSRIIFIHFGSAGWLIQFLVMFSDCILLPVLWWFWCRLLQDKQRSSISLAVLMIFLTIIITVFEDFFIFPILSALQIS